jgi:hypothetical protein
VDGGDTSDDDEVPAEFDVVVEAFLGVPVLVFGEFHVVAASSVVLPHLLLSSSEIRRSDGTDDVDTVDGSGLEVVGLEGRGIRAVEEGADRSTSDEILSASVDEEHVTGTREELDVLSTEEETDERAFLVGLGVPVRGFPVNGDSTALHPHVGVHPGVDPVGLRVGDQLASLAVQVSEGAERRPDGVRERHASDILVVSVGPLDERSDVAVSKRVGEVGVRRSSRVSVQVVVVRVGVVADVAARAVTRNSARSVATAKTSLSGAVLASEIVSDADSSDERGSSGNAVLGEQSVDEAQEASDDVAVVGGTSVVDFIAGDFQTVVETVDHVVEHISGELSVDGDGAEVAEFLDHCRVSSNRRAEVEVVRDDGDLRNGNGLNEDDDGVVGEDSEVPDVLNVDDGINTTGSSGARNGGELRSRSS